MFSFFRSRRASEERPSLDAAIPDGERVYAMGDIHGRDDLFAAIMAAIEADNRETAEAEATVILLGDLVDRGPDSRRVIAMAREWQHTRNVRILAGNHEEMFLRSFESLDTLRHFLRYGGRETLMSYGLDRSRYTRSSIEEVQEMMREAVPEEDVAFMQGFEDSIRIGDYVFVHAGIEPGVPLAEQDISRLRWIREPFLSHGDIHEDFVVVHGHTISEKPEDMGNRIGLDTGAYETGRLTAIVLEGTQRRYIAAVQGADGAICVEKG
ncbi:metallophosphoesterase [Aurantiacibacter gangjinensis]|uniref:Serine/threonine protein phosphatase n=1 Tax=Aurantiacibacter gangjinensis TaxID=502682 RepID=A0A0G9MSM0_9SPHN|nr:metallophosphoesterase [Aurantiacibacter gangjinensis]APE27137.1 Serine/threonine protein phosphatase [Aurantiacibacter gangjinensis]KLE33742.1 serine/threonine protein phosphatase [Aurantiacibacter gangjinensis]